MGFQLPGLSLQIACLFHKMKVAQLEVWLGLKNICNFDWISSARTMIPYPAFHNIYSLYPFVPYVFATAPQRLACPSAATTAPPPTTSAPFRRLMYEVLDLLPRGASPGSKYSVVDPSLQSAVCRPWDLDTCMYACRSDVGEDFTTRASEVISKSVEIVVTICCTSEEHTRPSWRSNNPKWANLLVSFYILLISLWSIALLVNLQP
jgi:hypothetical protein